MAAHDPTDPKLPALGRVDVSAWQALPHVQGRLATAEDVAAGRALFVLDAPSDRCAPAELSLPACGIQTLEDGVERPVVVVQAERLGADTLYGLRYLPGGGGVCLAEEVRLVPGPTHWFKG